MWHNSVAHHAVLHVLRYGLLVIAQKSVEAQPLVDGAFNLHAAGVHVAQAIGAGVLAVLASLEQ